MTDEQRLQMITEQLILVRDNLFRGMSKSIQKLQARSINELLELPSHTQSPPAQQEPVAKVCHDLDGHIGWNPNLRQLPDEGTALYTFPPAQRKPQGYAGITIWGGDVTITRIFTELEIKHARFPNELIKQAVQQCLDELAAHGITGENT